VTDDRLAVVEYSTDNFSKLCLSNFGHFDLLKHTNNTLVHCIDAVHKLILRR